MYVYESFLIYNIFAPVISTSIHRCVNSISHDIKVLMKVIKTERFNVVFILKWIRLIWVILFFLSSYCRI